MSVTVNQYIDALQAQIAQAIPVLRGVLINVEQVDASLDTPCVIIDIEAIDDVDDDDKSALSANLSITLYACLSRQSVRADQAVVSFAARLLALVRRNRFGFAADEVGCPEALSAMPTVIGNHHGHAIYAVSFEQRVDIDHELSPAVLDDFITVDGEQPAPEHAPKLQMSVTLSQV